MPQNPSNVTSISANLDSVRQRIADSASAASRAPQDITLLAVSKTKPVSAIEQAWLAGQRCFGENYLQEAVEKIQQLQGKGIQWHFIGPLQSNKTRPAAENFDWVHTIDRIKVARRLNDQRPAALAPLNICLQVNIDGEASKSGVSPQELPQLAAAIAPLKNLQLRGLMAIPAPGRNSQQQHQTFASVAQLLDNLRRQLPDQHHLDTLSMGMSADMDAAIQTGSTMVRIGTDIFGKRTL
ncbi:YggS family pyridoxal phosphate-dependent enzyme [Porticoccus sp. GXU_MW_L64]